MPAFERDRWIVCRIAYHVEGKPRDLLLFPSQQRMHATSARWGEYISRVHGKQLSDRLNCGSIAAEFAPVSLSLSLSTSASKYPLGPTRPTCALELLKFGRTFGGKNKKKRGRKENTVRNKVVSDKVVWLFQVMHHCRDERVNESTGKSTNRSSIMPA